MTSIVYNGLNLQTGGFTIEDSDIFAMPANTIQMERLAEEDGSVLVKATYEPKSFSVTGSVIGADIPTTDGLIDTLKTALNTTKQNFDIDWAGSTRRYVATPQNAVITRPRGLAVATFSVTFQCESPAGMDTTGSTLLSATTITTSTSVNSWTVNGSYKAQPVITLTLGSVSSTNPTDTITISNGSTLRGLSVVRTWAAADVLAIDCLNKTLYVNNLVTPFTGQFPTWDPGVGTVSYVDTFSTSRSATLSATYTRRFL